MDLYSCSEARITDLETYQQKLRSRKLKLSKKITKVQCGSNFKCGMIEEPSIVCEGSLAWPFLCLPSSFVCTPVNVYTLSGLYKWAGFLLKK